MARAGQGQFLFQRSGFQVVLENGFDARIGAGVKVQGAPAGGFQALMAHGFAQADDAQGGAKALFGVGPVGHDFLDHLGALRADGFGPLQDAAGASIAGNFDGTWAGVPPAVVERPGSSLRTWAATRLPC